jgi:prepilin-type N-terminal cleavage/methylation domain-containing protein
LINQLKYQAGYSLVEVMVAIMILAIAIIPMVSMFDAGLRAAMTGSSYDRARAIAGEELEEIKALPFSKNNPAGVIDSAVEFYQPVNSGGTEKPCSAPIDATFTCQVRTAYLDQNTLVEDGTARTMMSVRVTVTWDGGGPYTITGLTSKETR